MTGKAASEHTHDLSQAILGEAADWLVRLQSGEASPGMQAELVRWRARSAAHEAAWQRAQGMLATFQQIPPGLGRRTLARLETPDRRRALRPGLMALILLMLVLPVLWLHMEQMPWQALMADVRTAPGEQKTLVLADDTRLVLNTATAVDVSFSASERRLTLLAGEILVTTGKNPRYAALPLVVDTAQGSLRPLGTRFSVRRLDDSTRVAVFEGAVEVRPEASIGVATVRAGEQMVFTDSALNALQPADAGAELWAGGMLLARDMRLGALVAELARYHRGVLRCDPAVAGLVVSGAFPLADIDASLSLLAQSLPVRIDRATRWWATLRER